MYLGSVYPEGNLPWHYAPMYLAMTTPVAALLFFAGGLYLSLRYIAKKERLLESLIVVLWLFIPLLLEMNPGTFKYDGMRHFFICVPAIAIIAGIGLWKATAIVSRYGRYLPVLLAAIVFLTLIREVEIIHPYEGSYFNEAVRFSIPAHLEEYFDFDYWGAPYKQGVDWLNDNARHGSRICVPVAGHLIKFYDLRGDLTAGCGNDSDYVMQITGKFFMPDDFWSNMTREYTLVHRISRYDSDLLVIYSAVNSTAGD